MDRKDSRAFPGLLVTREVPERPGSLAMRVCSVLLEKRGRPGQLDCLDHRVELDRPDSQESPALKVVLASLDSKDHLGNRGSLGHKVDTAVFISCPLMARQLMFLHSNFFMF